MLQRQQTRATAEYDRQPAQRELSLVQMNLLAPNWVGAMYKLLPCYDEYASQQRLNKSLSYLSGFDAQIYCLSEVEESDLPEIRDFFGDDWSVVYASHKNGFWREWLEGKEWVSNGTCILVHRSLKRLSTAVIDLGDGCTASHALLQSASGLVSVTSVHFDNGENKWTEAARLLQWLERIKCDVNIVAGDFNFTDVSMFEEAGYVETAQDKQSTPMPQGRIDHTMVRGARRVSGRIHNLGDLCTTVHKNGSDHYATTSSILL